MDSSTETPKKSRPISFKAETRQILNILIHSLYTEREVFLRELISNASDALTRMSFEMLTNREVVDPETELAIWIKTDADNHTITIRDSGIGMTREELVENLGTIAHSGARAFLEAAEQGNTHLSDIIGQFGVGFYSAFMAADSIEVISRSYKPEAKAARWFSSGEDTFIVEPAEKAERGTTVTVKLKSDATEFAQESRVKEIIKKHSDFVPFPIYLGDSNEQMNQQSAIWRQQPRQVEEQKYLDFYKQLTLDFEPPLTNVHLAVDAPVQMYALLYVPASPERNMFSPRKEDGLKLYARKVLIQEYCKTLLPDFLRFIQGVVDSEDIPLNVSRESIQSNRVMAQLKKLITSKLLEQLKSLGQEKPETFEKFWQTYSRSIKEGIASEAEFHDQLTPLLRFHSLSNPEKWISLDDYTQNLKADQAKIYYILGDDDHSAMNSPHIEAFKHLGYDVLLLTDPLDSFMLLRLTNYQEHDFANVASEEVKMPEGEEKTAQEEGDRLPEDDASKLIERFKKQLGDKVSDVRLTDRLVESPARLVDPAGSLNPEMQRVYRILNREYKVPQKVLEINRKHPIVKKLSELPEEDPRNALVIDQIYENLLLIEGLHPDPASMVERIQQLIETTLKTK
jgi:molecular chaperone HtpG